MEFFEPLKVLLSDLTIEEFSQLMGYIFGFFVLSSFCVFIVFCFLNSFYNGRLHYKTKEYYGSLCYLNKLFKKLKSASTHHELDIADTELRSAIYLFALSKSYTEIYV